MSVQFTCQPLYTNFHILTLHAAASNILVTRLSIWLSLEDYLVDKKQGRQKTNRLVCLEARSDAPIIVPIRHQMTRKIIFSLPITCKCVCNVTYTSKNSWLFVYLLRKRKEQTIELPTTMSGFNKFMAFSGSILDLH